MTSDPSKPERTLTAAVGPNRSAAIEDATTAPAGSHLRRVFVAELDDYQDLVLLGRAALLRRAYCYVLLADGVIVHPAYLWQSHLSNQLVLDELLELFRPPLAQLALGDSPSVVDYINQRIDRLRQQAPDMTEELRKYSYWESRLLEQARKLDKRFTAGTPYRASESRDAQFRKLLSSDLNNSLDQHSILNQLLSVARQSKVAIDREEVKEALLTFVKDTDLVSIETFSNQVRVIGVPALAEQQAYKKRVLDIYYHANVNPQIHIPGLSSLSPDRVVDPFDADVFWAVFAKLLGKRNAQSLSSSADPTMVRTLRELRDHELWQKYRSIYCDILCTVEGSARKHAEHIVTAICAQTGQDRLFVLRRLWAQHKIHIVACVCTGLGISVGLRSILAGFGSLGFGLSPVFKDLYRFVQDYHSHELSRLRQVIDRQVESYIEQQTR